MKHPLTAYTRRRSRSRCLRWTVAILVLTIYLVFRWSPDPQRLSNKINRKELVSSDTISQLSTASKADLGRLHDETRHKLLHANDFDAYHAATSIRASQKLASGRDDTFNPSLTAYVDRLQTFVDTYLTNAPAYIKRGLEGSLTLVRDKRAIKTGDEFPRILWSTHPKGQEGVDRYFYLWTKTLHLALPRSLLKWLDGLAAGLRMPAEKGGEWKVNVANDDDIDAHISSWVGEKVVREQRGEGKWADIWGRLPFGVLRSDIFRYMALLMEGGLYGDADTAPVVHPYLWGIDAVSAIHPDLAMITSHLDAPPKFLAKIKEKEFTPPYAPLRKDGGAFPVNSILDPDVSIVVSIEWDTAIAFDIKKITQWTPFRLKRAWKDYGYVRSLQILQYLMMSKPFHPILLDTLATIAELVERGDLQAVGALDLTGPGPFTDAVLRYLLVRYGVTPDDLRNLGHSVRIGDVIILREESFMISDGPFDRFMRHFRSIFPDPTSIGNQAKNVWYYGIGYNSWKSGGLVVARHGLTGLWKNQGW